MNNARGQYNTLDLAGRTLGRWKVIKLAFANSNGRYWICQCQCGTERAVSASKLLRGLSKSCGCVRLDRQRKPQRDRDLKRADNLQRKYGIDAATLKKILAKQKNKCAVCRTPLTSPHVDHDHEKQRVRGLLCHRCNIVVGGLDNPVFRKKIIAYLARSGR